MKERKAGSFLYGTAVLTGGMAAVKLMGALFKIPLSRTVGEYGMGLFNLAYSFYGPVLSLATAGLPVAVARLVSQRKSQGRYREAFYVRRAATPLFLLLGAAGMAALMLFAPVYCARGMGAPQAVLPMLALAPSALFAAGSSVYRGYWEGFGDMAPTALSQMLEAAVKLGLGLFLSFKFIQLGEAEYARRGTVLSFRPPDGESARLLLMALGAAGGILGVTAGCAASFLFLWLLTKKRGSGFSDEALRASPPVGSRKALRRELMRFTAPVAAGAVAQNAAGLIDATVLQGRLTALFERPGVRWGEAFGRLPPGFLTSPQTAATFLYGCYTLAMTVYLLVPALSQAVAVSALPAVTEAYAGGDGEALLRRVREVLKVTLLAALPMGFGMSALAEPIAAFLYGQSASTPIVAGTLRLLGPAAVCCALGAPLGSLLQAVGRADLPVKLLLAAMAVKLCANRFLCGLPALNIYGAAVGTFLCYLLYALGQWAAFRRLTGLRLSLGRLFLPPAFCAGACALTAAGCHRALGALPGLSDPAGGVRIGISVAAAAIIFFFGAILTRFLGKRELFLLPGGQKIAKTLEKWGWI